ncbi:hypothetical protein WN48_08545 [Eufriesea mexicana]|uniref:Uncharacterized protein n=1 Tax=Eufriesea mexicana TaxID=516756 RepID=A0A310SHX8_9HYME|nr:hypothetical protein WN48_08545 [Eufriesea mexicana]
MELGFCGILKDLYISVMGFLRYQLVAGTFDVDGVVDERKRKGWFRFGPTSRLIEEAINRSVYSTRALRPTFSFGQRRVRTGVRQEHQARSVTAVDGGNFAKAEGNLALVNEQEARTPYFQARLILRSDYIARTHHKYPPTTINTTTNTPNIPRRVFPRNEKASVPRKLSSTLWTLMEPCGDLGKSGAFGDQTQIVQGYVSRIRVLGRSEPSRAFRDASPQEIKIAMGYTHTKTRVHVSRIGVLGRLGTIESVPQCVPPVKEKDDGLGIVLQKLFFGKRYQLPGLTTWRWLRIETRTCALVAQPAGAICIKGTSIRYTKIYYFTVATLTDSNISKFPQNSGIKYEKREQRKTKLKSRRARTNSRLFERPTSRRDVLPCTRQLHASAPSRSGLAQVQSLSFSSRLTRGPRIVPEPPKPQSRHEGPAGHCKPDRHFASQPHGVELNHPCGLTVDTMSVQLRTRTPVAFATGAAGPPHQVQKKQ